MKTKFLFLLPLILGLTACQTATQTATPTASPIPIITATLAPTVTPYATATPILPSPSPTTPPIQGRTTAPVNVRPNPQLLGQPLGLLPGDTVVSIFGQTSAGDWYRIAYAQSPDGFGWVASDFIAVANPQVIPIIATETPSAAGTGEENLGLTLQQLNVRSGPGVDYEALGILPPNATITLLGITDGGHWYKIAWDDAPDGTGWVYAPYVQTEASGLPIFVPSEDGTATPLPATFTPTPQPAEADGDDAAHPLTGIVLDADQPTAIFSDDLSAPLGDASDTLQIVIHTTDNEAASLLIRLECEGGAPQITLSPLPLADPLTCNQPYRSLSLLPNRPYLLTLSLDKETREMIYMTYTVYLSLP